MEASFLEAQTRSTEAVAKAVESLQIMVQKEAENSSRDWPKFDGKVLSYAMWKKDWKRHHLDVYPSLTVHHLKRVLIEKCLPDGIKERVRFKETMEEVWKSLDTAFVKPTQFFHELMQPITTAKVVQEGDWKALEMNMELLQHTFEQAREAGMLETALHVTTVDQMIRKWPFSEQVRLWERTVGVSPMDMPEEFRKYIEERYPVAASLAAQMEVHCGRGDGGGRQKGVTNAASAVAGRPCKMASQGCKERHPPEFCEVFKNLSSEAKLAKLQEWNRCLYCFKHWEEQECFARKDNNYKGCGINGCKGHHHEDLHYVIETARMF